MSNGNRIVKVTASLVRETEKAFQVYQANRENVWIPRSQCGRVSRGAKQTLGGVEEQRITMEIPEWLREDKGLTEDMR